MNRRPRLSGGRRPSRPAGYPAQKRAKDRQGVALIVASVAIALGLGAAVAALKPEPYDEATLCLAEPTPQRTMVLIDRSDALIGPDRVRGLIEAAESRLPVHGRLSIYELGPGGEALGDALFDLCNPGRGAQVSAVYRNPRRVQAFYEDQFRGPLDAVLDAVTRPVEAPTSPIVESIAEILRRVDDGYGAAAVELIVVSDFLQNTAAYGSAYRGGGPLRAEAAAALLAGARGATPTRLEAVVMQRSGRGPLQDGVRQSFWTPALDAAGLTAVWR